MIKIICDICGNENSISNVPFFGVASISKSGLIFVSRNDDFPKITDCEKHICGFCLHKLGWKATMDPEEDNPA